LLHSKCNLGFAPRIFGLHSFCGRCISLICHRHSTPSIETDLQLDMYSAEELPKSRQGGRFMTKREKQSKVQKRGKLPRGSSAKRGKARRVSRAAKRTVAKAKRKPAPVKKVARKVKQPVTPVVETVAVEVIEQPAPGVITVTEVEQTQRVAACPEKNEPQPLEQPGFDAGWIEGEGLGGSPGA
jgi:hypothetical protein